MVANINELPLELRRHIFHILKLNTPPDGFRSFLNALLACRVWHDTGKVLLYTDVALDPPQLVRFARSFPSGQRLTRTLTIYIAPINHRKQRLLALDDFRMSADFQEKDVKTAIRELPMILHGMTKLESFSLIVPPGRLMQFGVTTTMEQILPALLCMMPDTVKHLEIDAAGFMDMRHHHSQFAHLCHVLGRRLPTLRNLRLRGRKLCSELFVGTPDLDTVEDQVSRNDTPAPVVRREYQTIIINAIEYAFDGTKETAIFSEGGPRMLMPEEEVVNLAVTAQSAFRNGRLANLKRLSFFALKDRPSGRKGYAAINELVVGSSSKVIRSPYQQVGDPKNINPERCFLRFRQVDGTGAEAWGSWSDCINLAEGKVWIQTAEGYRLPKAYFKKEGRFSQSVLQTPMLLKGEQISRRARGALFEKEAQAGQKLLVAGETPGLSLLQHLTRQSTVEEVDAEFAAVNLMGLSGQTWNMDSDDSEASIYIESDDEDRELLHVCSGDDDDGTQCQDERPSHSEETGEVYEERYLPEADDELRERFLDNSRR